MRFVAFLKVETGTEHAIVIAQNQEEAEIKLRKAGFDGESAAVFEESFILKLANAEELHDNLPVIE